MKILNKIMRMSNKAKLAAILVTIFVISAVVQSIFLPTTIPLGPVAAGKLRKWESQLGKFSLDYPENWLAFELPDGSHGDKEVIAFISPKNNNFPQVIISQRTFPTAKIDDVASWGENRNKQRGKYLSIKLENINTTNITGKIREYTIGFDTYLGLKVKHCLDLYTLNHGLGYQSAFCANEGDWSNKNGVFQQMIQSFAFTQ